MRLRGAVGRYQADIPQPRRSSTSRAVARIETTIEPKQPNRFE